MDFSKYTREKLIELCKKAVVHHTKWGDRDSYSAQKNIQSIHMGLVAGFDFRVVTKEDVPDYHSDASTLIIEFLSPIDTTKLTSPDCVLEISSREDYWKDCDPKQEGEMFDGEGIDFNSNFTQSYMPTEEKLALCDGADWY